MRISDWSSDVCSSDLPQLSDASSPADTPPRRPKKPCATPASDAAVVKGGSAEGRVTGRASRCGPRRYGRRRERGCGRHRRNHSGDKRSARSEEHTSELQSLLRISYAVFCLKKKN